MSIALSHNGVTKAIVWKFIIRPNWTLCVIVLPIAPGSLSCFILHLPYNQWLSIFFNFLPGHLYVFLVNIFIFFPPFLDEVDFFFLLSFTSTLYIWGINWQISGGKISFSACGENLHSKLNIFFGAENLWFYIFLVVYLYFYLLSQ